MGFKQKQKRLTIAIHDVFSWLQVSVLRGEAVAKIISSWSCPCRKSKWAKNDKKWIIYGKPVL
jgi:hypothetical protein